MTPSLASAQDTPADDQSVDAPAEGEEDVVVTGIRGALESAKEIKRNADTFVDSITASDISTLPDLSVAEALGRIPGVTVSRFPTGGASPDFPAAEGRGNLIRGLGFVRSEFNGRDAFTANAGRALDWSSIAPELVGGVDVYKNQSSDLIEGGIGGTINLRTLEPFDRKGPVVAVALDGTYSDLRKKWSPAGSITLGNRWQVGGGEFGILGSYSRSVLNSRTEGWQQGSPVPRVVNADGTISGNAPTGAGRMNEFNGVDPSRIIGTTAGFQMRTNNTDRDRQSYYGAMQWKSDNLLATFKYIRVDTQIESTERTLEWWPEHDNAASMSITDLVTTPWTGDVALCSGNGGSPSNPGDCENMIPVGGGLMESGTVSSEGDGWLGGGATGDNRPLVGVPVAGLGIGKKEETTTEDYSLNFKWNAGDRLFVELDGQYTRSSARFMELWGGTNTWLNYNVNADLDNPLIEFYIPTTTGGRGNVFNPCQTRTTTADTCNNSNTPADETSFIASPTSSSDLNGVNWNYAADRWQEGTGELYALRGDFTYDLTGGDGFASWFEAVKFGARYSERSQTNKEMGLNWGSVAPAWGGNGGMAIAGTYADTSGFEAIDYSDFFRGGVVEGENSSFAFVSEDLLHNYTDFRNYLTSNVGGVGWNPRGIADGSEWGTPNFNPEDISDITEKTTNAYARLDFKREFDNGMSIDANVGVRYVKTDLSSAGYLSYDDFDADQPSCTVVITTNCQATFDSGGTRIRTETAESQDHARDFLPQAAAYSDRSATPITVDVSDEHWLPSFNMKFNLNREMLFRFAYSKGMTRPNVQDLRASQLYTVNTNRVDYPPITDEDDPMYGIDQGAADINIDQITVTRGNPFLKPTTADSFDISYEWYFKGGYFSLAGFYKDMKNIITTGDMTLGSEILDGEVIQIIYNGPVNQAQAKIKGVEVAYQQFFDFLPGPLKHFGVQANYTYIDATATPPPNGVDTNGDGVPDDLTTVFRFGVDDMLGQSKHILNAVAIYQDSKLEARLAYGWRSEYLTTYRDWVTGNPVYNSAAGFLDASLKYKFTDQFQFRASIANILDTKSKARVLLNEDGDMYDRFSFLNDRRIVVGVLFQM